MGKCGKFGRIKEMGEDKYESFGRIILRIYIIYILKSRLHAMCVASEGLLLSKRLGMLNKGYGHRRGDMVVDWILSMCNRAF